MFISKNSSTKQSQLVLHDSEWEIINLNIIIKKIHLLSTTQRFSLKDHSFVLSSNNGNDKRKHSLFRYSYLATTKVVFHLVFVSSI